ncbi:MAG: hypothetical protein RLP15_12935 [Cryomorphaceae bacterium]
MTVKQIKQEIQKSLEDMPETVLQQVLEYLKAVQKSGTDKAQLSADLSKILKEDKDLLHRLAQ